MKLTRKLVSLLLALTLIVALATTAAAASITINGNLPSDGSTTTGETYNAYKIFDANYAGETVDSNTNIAYTIDSSSPFFEELNKISGLLTQVNSTTTYIVDTSKITNDNINTIVATLKSVVDTKNVQPTGTAKANTSGNATIDNLDKGYYLVTSTLGSKIIVDTLGSVTVNTKNTYPTVTKTEDKTTADYGETVTYTVTVTIPENAVGAITLHDTMTNMTYNENSVSAKVKDTETTVAITKQDASDGCTLHFVISADAVAANLGKTVEVTYTANVDGGKNTGENKVKLEYSNYMTPEVKVEVKNYKLDVFKYTKNGESETGLAGAGFVLAKQVTGEGDTTKTVYYKKTDSNTIEWVDSIGDATELKTTADSYTVTFDGLANGTYTLIEKTVPAGYNQAQNVEVTIQDADKTGDTQIKVLNQSGTELPSTGGIGTTIFYVLGSVLILGAAVLLVTKKRMSAEG